MDESRRRPRQVDGDGAAKRRRLRRLRSWWRHEQQTVAAVLATFQHHSAPRGPRTARTGEGARDEPHGYAPEDAPPQGRILRHVVGHLPAPSVDVSVPQMVDQLPDIEHFFAALSPDPEQVIEVPKILPFDVPMRAALRVTQLVEQLVEVPTIISYSSLQPSLFGEAFKAFLKDKVQKRVVEQPVDFPVPGGGGPSSGLQGFFSGKSSTAVFGAENVDTPVPHGCGGGARGGLQGLSQGQGSTAVCGAEHVVTPVPHGGDLHGLSQGQGSTALCGADHVDIPVPHGRVGKRGLHGFPRGQSSTASAVEQTFSQAPHRSMPRAPVHGRHDEWVCVIDVENSGEHYWNRWDNSGGCRGESSTAGASGLCRDVVLQEDFWDLPPL